MTEFAPQLPTNRDDRGPGRLPRGKSLVRQGVLAIAIALPCAMVGLTQQQSQDQPVPDAPAVQQPDNSLKSITSKVAPGEGTQAETPDSDQAPPASPITDANPQKTPPVIPSTINEEHRFLIQVPVNFVTVPVTVLDRRKQQVAGLTWRDFQIYENNQRQAIAFFSADAVPLSVALVIDQSLPADSMKKVNDSLGAIPGAFTSSDEIAVFTYDNGVNNETDFTAALGARIPAVLQASKRAGEYMGVPVNGGPLYSGPIINNHPVDPNLEPQRENSGFGVMPKEVHTLNDAILAAGAALSTREKGRRRIIYVIGDGKESRSKATFREVVRYLDANGIAVYGTLVGDSATWGLGYLDTITLPLLPLSPDNILPRYADLTGGQLSAEFSENGIQRSFGQLMALARTEYTLGFYSHLPRLAGSYRSITVDVLRPNLNVIAEKGYYPSATNLMR